MKPQNRPCQLPQYKNSLLALTNARSDHCMQISLHKIKNHVYVSVVFTDADSVQAHDVGMFSHFEHNLNLAKCPHRVNFICERVVNLLHSHTISISFVDRFPNDAVVPFAHLLNHLVLGLNVGTNIVLLIRTFILDFPLCPHKSGFVGFKLIQDIQFALTGNPGWIQLKFIIDLAC